MYRAAVERPRTLRAWRKHLAFRGVRCDEAEGRLGQAGRHRKQPRLADCGRPGCWLCKGHKRFRRPTLAEYRSALALREWTAEHGRGAARRPRRPT